MAIPDEDVAQVRAATDIAAVIGEHTALKRVGRRYVGLCPFHGEKTPSFSVNVEEGLYYCFGCQASGDAITFVRAIEGCDFVDAVERLASRAGITIRNDADPASGADRGRRERLLEAVAAAVEHYHEVLLHRPEAGRTRQYLRSRGYDGEVVRKFRIGYAPDSYDELVRALRLPSKVLTESGLAFESDRGGVYDAFRDRVLFPIFDPGGRAIAIGGRVLPEELRTNTRNPGPKYRNSPESAIYVKRRTLYGLNWAKAEIALVGEAIVCEGYTDVLGFHLAGLHHAVATCGTALTEEHVDLLSRFAKRIVLCFDADNAGKNAAARLYEWERRHGLELAVAALPDGSDPAELARTSPEVLVAAIKSARPFLGFRLEQALGAADLSTPEGRARAADAAIAAIAEHPNELVRDEYLVELADRTRLDIERLRTMLDAERSSPRDQHVEQSTAAASRRRSERSDEARDEPPDEPPQPSRRAPIELRAGRDALVLAIQRPEEVAGLFHEVLFLDPLQRRAFAALCSSSQLHQAIEGADPPTAELLRRLAVTEPDAEAEGTLIALAFGAARRALSEIDKQARRAAQEGDSEAFAAASAASRWLQEELTLLRDAISQPGVVSPAVGAAERLVAWLAQQPQQG